METYRIYVAELMFGGVLWTVTHGKRDRVLMEGEADTLPQAQAEAEEWIRIAQLPPPPKRQLELF